MKALPVLGVLLLILGALSFVIPMPHRDDHSVSVGDAKFTLQTESRHEDLAKATCTGEVTEAEAARGPSLACVSMEALVGAKL